MTQFERVQKLAKERGVKVSLADKPGWCVLDMPSRISPDRKMPPLTFATAEHVLEDRSEAPKIINGRLIRRIDKP